MALFLLCRKRLSRNIINYLYWFLLIFNKCKGNILVVGAGFAGAVVARILSEYGYHIDIIDSRPHIAGNCYDPINIRNNVRTHKYGPHIFHTNSKEIFNFLSRFTRWIPYEHKVEAFIETIGYVPFPINITTINRLYNIEMTTKPEMESFLATLCEDHGPPKNARQAAENHFGKELVELFFARYTKKMWDIELEQLPVSVFSRLPIRFDKNTKYFNDQFQAMPLNGYVHLFENLLDHPNIKIALSTSFDINMENHYYHVFNSMAIDDYYNNEFSPLPYRSIRFNTRLINGHSQSVPTINLTDESPITRYTDWRLYPGCGILKSKPFITYETPCSYEENNNERFYPVKTVDGAPQKRYKRYQNLATSNKKCTFIGRCGQYRYLDMHQVVANSLLLADRFLKIAD